MKKRCLALLMMLLLVASTVAASMANAIDARADGEVIYDGNARAFIFEPGSKKSPKDLFDSFKGVMPGDSLKQKIVVRNAASNKVKVKIYMRALGWTGGSEENVDFSSEELLEQLNLKVVQDGTSVLFDAPASETAQLSDWVCLGTFYSGASVTLDLTLDIPITLENPFEEAFCFLDWEFMVEEFPIEPTDPKPDTGDDMHVGLYILLGGGSLAILFILLVLLRHRKEDEAGDASSGNGLPTESTDDKS